MTETIATTAPTMLATIQQETGQIPVTNTGPTDVYVGGSSVAVSGDHVGYLVAVRATVNVPASAAEDNILYGIVASGSTTVSMLLPGSPE